MEENDKKQDVKVEDLAPKKDAKGGAALSSAASQDSASMNAATGADAATQNAPSANRFEQNAASLDSGKNLD